jgi:hypothetical protein
MFQLLKRLVYSASKVRKVFAAYRMIHEFCSTNLLQTHCQEGDHSKEAGSLEPQKKFSSLFQILDEFGAAT